MSEKGSVILMTFWEHWRDMSSEGESATSVPRTRRYFVVQTLWGLHELVMYRVNQSDEGGLIPTDLLQRYMHEVRATNRENDAARFLAEYEAHLRAFDKPVPVALTEFLRSHNSGRYE